MKIFRLTLHNFRQFKDFSIEFSTDKDKNVSIVLAENSTGKTTLMQSVNWCLYGEEEADLENKSSMLNQTVQRTSNREKEEYWVELEIIENNVMYKIKRSRTVFTKSHRYHDDYVSMEYKNNNGETIILSSENGIEEEKKINRMINQILTKEMSKYFLFDGERINNLGSNSVSSRRDIQKAISAISGMPILENALSSLNKIERGYRNELTDSAKDSDLSKLNIERNKLERNIKDYTEKIEELELVRSKQVSTIKKLDDSLSQYDKVDDLIKARTKIESQLTQTERQLPELRESIYKKIKEHRSKSFIYQLNKKYKNLNFNESYRDKTIPNMQADSIDTIIDRGTCICGEKISEEHLVHLIEQRDFQPPISNAQLISSFSHDIKLLTSGLNNIHNDIYTVTNDYYTRTDHKYSLEEELKELNTKIGNADSDEIKNKNSDREHLKVDLSKNIEQIGMYKGFLENSEKDLKEVSKLYDKISKEKSLNIIKKLKVELLNESIRYLEVQNEKDKQERKQAIEEKANKHLSEIIYKNKKIILNDKFEYQVQENNNITASPSEGERVSISISLILAIIDAHKERISKSSKKQLNTEINKEFSILMDAAFATLDEQFSRRISEKLPKSIEQVILFSTGRQFDGPVRESLEPYIGKQYELTIPNKNNENYLTNDDLKSIELEVK